MSENEEKNKTFIEAYYWNKHQEQKILAVQDINGNKIILIEDYIMGDACAKHDILQRIFGNVINEKIPFTQ